MRNQFTVFAVAALLSACGALPAAADDSAAELLEQAQQAARQGKHAKAVTLAGRAIEQDATLADAYYLRGRERFRLGQIRESVADFDKLVELRPNLESRQWERGIAMYYAGEYQRGAAQFELYQTFHDNDVENSVWRYLCVAKTEGVDKAQATILPIKDDRRVPMMQVFEMYRGRLAPDDVLAAAREGEPSDEELYARLFYAHLYIGLYYDAAGKEELAAKHIREAAGHDKPNARINRYMWDVARIHKELLDDEKER